ncbi:MAG: hypothetical protein PVJ61_00860 [Dehalococcoidia bacterium]|jgi:hypothetical protein
MLTSLLADTVRSIVFEPNYVCKDHRNLYSHFYSKKHERIPKYTNRLHFFDVPDVNVDDLVLNPQSYRKSYIGYSVIRPVAERCIGRTVINPQKLAKFKSAKPYCLTADFKTHIGGQHFIASGYPYMSQDVDVTVCAHTALWGVCRYLSEKYSMYGETYPFDLINLTEPSQGRTFPYRGMTYSDYSRILSEFGVHPCIMRIRRFGTNPLGSLVFNNEEYLDLCAYLESGFPALTSFLGHVITIIGHTIDYAKSPDADVDGFVDSSSFHDRFIVVDDNFPPYQLLGDFNDEQNYGRAYATNPEVTEPQGISMKSMITAVCPLPEKVFLPANRVRKKARRYLLAYKQKISAKDEPIVLRLFLTTNTSFQRRKVQAIDRRKPDMLNYIVTRMELPHFIWVMEAGPVSLYRQGKCTAEIVMDSTANPNEDANIYIRLQNTLTVEGRSHKIHDAPEEFNQYTHNLGEM